jgi:hypothetical protein
MQRVAACPRQISESSVVEITSLAGLGAALKIYINEESHTKLIGGCIPRPAGKEKIYAEQHVLVVVQPCEGQTRCSKAPASQPQ